MLAWASVIVCPVVFLTNLETLKGRAELAEDIARLVLDFGPRQ